MTLSWSREPGNDSPWAIRADHEGRSHTENLSPDTLALTGERLLAVVVDLCAECVRRVEAPSP